MRTVIPDCPDGGAAVLCDLPGGAADPDGGGGAVLPRGLRTGPAAHRPPSGARCASWGRRSGRRGAASCAGGDRSCGGGSCACPCPAWGPQRTSMLAACGCPGGTTSSWGPPGSRRSWTCRRSCSAMGAQVSGGGDARSSSIEGGRAPPPRGTYRHGGPDRGGHLSVRGSRRRGRDG